MGLFSWIFKRKKKKYKNKTIGGAYPKPLPQNFNGRLLDDNYPTTSTTILTINEAPRTDLIIEQEIFDIMCSPIVDEDNIVSEPIYQQDNYISDASNIDSTIYDDSNDNNDSFEISCDSDNNFDF